MRHRHPPVLHSEWPVDEPRRVAWLELFYDLVYVAAVIQIGDLLSEDVSWDGFWHFAVLFFVLWWSWTGTTAYFNRFLVDDTPHRLLVVVQMFAVANIAISAPLAFAATSRDVPVLGVAWSLVLVRLVLVAMLARSYRHCPSARPALRPAIVWTSVGAAVFAVAPFVEPGPRAWVWLAGIGVSMWGGLARGAVQMEEDVPGDHEHLAERYALLTMIVLGESFVKTVTGLAEEGASLGDEMLGGLGLAVIVGLWWTYFDRIADGGIPPGFWGLQRWMYLHLPLMLAITSLGVGTKKIALSELGEPTDPAYALLFGGSAAVVLLSMAGLLRIQGDRRAAVGRAAAAAVLLVVAVALGDVLGVAVLALVVAAVVALPNALDPAGPDAEGGAGPELPDDAPGSAPDPDDPGDGHPSPA